MSDYNTMQHDIIFSKELAKLIHHFPTLIDEDGKLTHSSLKEIDPNILLKAYASMHLSRSFEQQAMYLQRTGRLGTFPPATGQEAIYTAIGLNLTPEDSFFPYYRDHATLLMRGTTPSMLFQAWGGDERGHQKTSHHQDHPISIPISTQCSHAVGAALAIKQQHKNAVALVTIGDGGTSRGDFYESLNFSTIHQLPIIFVVNNNQWAISVPLHKQSATQDIAQKALGFGLKAHQVDGHDVAGTYLALRTLYNNIIEKKQGPQVLEARCLRPCDHTTADDRMRYQTEEEQQQATILDPIKRLKAYLLQNDEISSGKLTKLEQDNKTYIEKETQHILEQDKPSTESMFEYLYASPPNNLYTPLQTQSSVLEDKHDHA